MFTCLSIFARGLFFSHYITLHSSSHTLSYLRHNRNSDQDEGEAPGKNWKKKKEKKDEKVKEPSKLKRKAEDDEDEDGDEEDDEGDGEEVEKSDTNGEATGNGKRKRKKKQKKAKGPNNWVYVSGLPKDISMEEIKDHFSKVHPPCITPSHCQLFMTISRTSHNPSQPVTPLPLHY